MTSSPFWPAMRVPMAFLVAPLAVPLLAVLVLELPLSEPYIVTFLFIITFVTYAGVVIFGIPTYLVLRSGKWTNFWIAPIVGFIVGMVMWYVTFALFEIVLGHTWSYALSSVAAADEWVKALRFGAPAGAAVGTIFWLIARPDIPAPSREDRDQRV